MSHHFHVKPPDKITPDEARWMLGEARWYYWSYDKKRAYGILEILAAKMAEYHEEHDLEKDYERVDNEITSHWWG